MRLRDYSIVGAAMIALTGANIECMFGFEMADHSFFQRFASI